MLTKVSGLLFATVGLASLAVLANGCSGDCDISNTCNGAIPADGGGEAVATDGPKIDAPADCVDTADVKDAPKCVVDSFGVFVDATGGKDGNPGTMAAPVKSITTALAKRDGKPRVYVCEGTYPEHVALTGAVSLYGGFACAGWAHTKAKVTIAPTDKGPAVELRDASAKVVLSDLEVTAIDAVDRGESGIAARIVNATDVTLRRMLITAGKGMDGLDAAADGGTFSPANAPDGTAGAAGGAATPNLACATSIGGVGGKDGPGVTNGGNGVVAVAPAYPTSVSNGAGGTAAAANCNGGSSGANGSYGIAGTPGAGAPSLGELTDQGWKGRDGTAGVAGGNGQGGGGGAQISATGVGGAGGPGGCGGGGGAKGTAGGASVAILAFQSSLRLEATTLVAKDAGRGGNGGGGQVGQLPGNGAAPNATLKACSGGAGGIGGSGGGGGAGAGGVSAGILYKGPAPTLEGVATPAADALPSVTLGAKGLAGTKGTGGAAADPGPPASRAGADATDAVGGQAKAVMGAP